MAQRKLMVDFCPPKVSYRKVKLTLGGRQWAFNFPCSILLNCFNEVYVEWSKGG